MSAEKQPVNQLTQAYDKAFAEAFEWATKEAIKPDELREGIARALLASAMKRAGFEKSWRDSWEVRSHSQLSPPLEEALQVLSRNIVEQLQGAVVDALAHPESLVDAVLLARGRKAYLSAFKKALVEAIAERGREDAKAAAAQLPMNPEQILVALRARDEH